MLQQDEALAGRAKSLLEMLLLVVAGEKISPTKLIKSLGLLTQAQQARGQGGGPHACLTQVY